MQIIELWGLAFIFVLVLPGLSVYVVMLNASNINKERLIC